MCWAEKSFKKFLGSYTTIPLLLAITALPFQILAQSITQNLAQNSPSAPSSLIAQAKTLPNQLPTRLPRKASAPRQKKLQTGEPPKFSGLIQYLDGSIKWRNGREAKSIGFKTIIQEGDDLILEDKALLKIVTKERCIGVLYGPGLLLTPTPQRPQWKTQKLSSRWICPNSLRQELLIDGSRVELNSGSEILYSQNQLLVRKDPVTSVNIPLRKDKIYELNNRSFVLAKKELSPRKIWEFNQLLPAPRESLKEAEPKKERTLPMLILVGNGGASFEPENGTFDNRGMSTQFLSFKTAPISTRPDWIFSASLSEMNHRDKDSDKSFFDPKNGPEPFGLHSRMEMIYFEMGYQKPISQKTYMFYKLGLGGSSWMAHYRMPTSPGPTAISFNGEMKYLLATISVGAEYQWRGSEHWDWWGLNLGVEFRATRTLSGLEESSHFYHDGSLPNTDQLFGDRFGNITTWALFIYLGPALYF